MRRRALAAQARAETVLQLRRGENLIVTLAIPVGILVFFAKVDTISTDFAHPVDFLVPGVLSLAVMAAAMVSLGIATGFERRYGVLKRLGTTPLSRGGLLAAKTATVLGLEVLQIVLLVLVGMACGWHVPGGIVPAVGLLLIGTIAFAGVGMLMAGTLRAEANLAAANGLFLLLLLPARQAADRDAGLRQGAARGRALRDGAGGPVLAGVPRGGADRAVGVGGRRAAARRALLPLGGIARRDHFPSSERTALSRSPVLT